MKKLFFLFFALVLVVGCSIEAVQEPIMGLDGKDGVDGQDGYNSIIEQVSVQPDEEHPYGGIYIKSGLDLDRDNILDDNEVTATSFVSNGVNGLNGADGKDGISSYIKVEEDTPSEGITTITVWLDLDGDGELDEGEVTDVFTISDGRDGADGQGTFITVEVIEPGEDCEYGGLAVTTGIIGGESETVILCCSCCVDEDKCYDYKGNFISSEDYTAEEIQEFISQGATEVDCNYED